MCLGILSYFLKLVKFQINSKEKMVCFNFTKYTKKILLMRWQLSEGKKKLWLLLKI